MRKLLALSLVGFIVAGLVITEASWLSPGNESSDGLGDSPSGSFLLTSKAGGCSCMLCHDVHGGGPGSGLLKEHPVPKDYPLECLDCHFPHPLVDEPECFDCHECGADHADLPLQDDCFDCHGAHNQYSAPDLSNEGDCFLCHEVSS